MKNRRVFLNIEDDILFSVGGFFVSNEGTKKAPNYHVWIPGITHATCDSAYHDFSLAQSRCEYLAKNWRKDRIFN